MFYGNLWERWGERERDIYRERRQTDRQTDRWTDRYWASKIEDEDI